MTDYVDKLYVNGQQIPIHDTDAREDIKMLKGDFGVLQTQIQELLNPSVGLTIRSYPAMDSDKSIEVEDGDIVALAVFGYNDNSYSFQWQSKGASNVWANISGATDFKYTFEIGVNTPSNYRCQLQPYGSGSPIYTDAVSLSFVDPPIEV